MSICLHRFTVLSTYTCATRKNKAVTMNVMRCFKCGKLKATAKLPKYIKEERA